MKLYTLHFTSEVLSSNIVQNTRYRAWDFCDFAQFLKENTRYFLKFFILSSTSHCITDAM
jgi:hypothetical protein